MNEEVAHRIGKALIGMYGASTKESDDWINLDDDSQFTLQKNPATGDWRVAVRWYFDLTYFKLNKVYPVPYSKRLVKELKKVERSTLGPKGMRATLLENDDQAAGLLVVRNFDEDFDEAFMGDFRWIFPITAATARLKLEVFYQERIGN